jgi:hypothetical protein
MKGRPIMVEYQGEPRCLEEISSLLGVPGPTLYARYAAGRRGAELFAPVDTSKKFDASQIPTSDAHADTAYLARFPLGSERPTVVSIDGKCVRLPDYNKRRASVVSREARSWWFDATRSSVGRPLCPPGAAAIAKTEPQAIAAAMAVMAQYKQAIRDRKKTMNITARDYRARAEQHRPGGEGIAAAVRDLACRGLKPRDIASALGVHIDVVLMALRDLRTDAHM